MVIKTLEEQINYINNRITFYEDEIRSIEKLVREAEIGAMKFLGYKIDIKYVDIDLFNRLKDTNNLYRMYRSIGISLMLDKINLDELKNKI